VRLFKTDHDRAGLINIPACYLTLSQVSTLAIRLTPSMTACGGPEDATAPRPCGGIARRGELLEDDLVIERLLEPGSTELPTRRCGGHEIDGGRSAGGDERNGNSHLRCPACDHEMRLTVWSGYDGEL
jgi:hypothetical protein